MNWHAQYEESLRLGEEALALLGDDNESNEAGWANALISFSHLLLEQMDKALEFGMRNAAFAARLSYRNELDNLTFGAIACAFEWRRDPAESRRWAKIADDIAGAHQSLQAIGESLM